MSTHTCSRNLHPFAGTPGPLEAHLHMLSAKYTGAITKRKPWGPPTNNEPAEKKEKKRLRQGSQGRGGRHSWSQGAEEFQEKRVHFKMVKMIQLIICEFTMIFKNIKNFKILKWQLTVKSKKKKAIIFRWNKPLAHLKKSCFLVQI